MATDAEILARFEAAQDALLISRGEVALGSLVERVKHGVINLEPEFQRRERWSRKQQSALIESFLLNVPIPPVFLAEEPNSPYIVIDGKQRLQSITSFLDGELELSELERFVELEGLTFRQLPGDIRQALELRMSLDVVTVLRQSDPSWKYEVFYRLNTGGEQLGSQEIRNVAFRGPLNTVIMRASENEFLRKQLKIKNTRSPAYARMLDAEMVLRFLTMRESWNDFGRPYRESLDSFMRERREVSQDDADGLAGRFVRAIDFCDALWGDRAFRRPTKAGWRDQFISAMYDAQMVAVDLQSDSKIKKLVERRAEVLQRTEQLASDEKFVSAITSATNNRLNVSYRVETMVDLLDTVNV